MYSLTNLNAKIVDIQNNNLSGVLMVSGQSPALQNKTSTYSLRFESGDLARIGGATQVHGADAFVELIQLQSLTEPRWFPLNPTPDWANSAQVSRQEISGFLGLATAPGNASAKTTTAQSAPAKGASTDSDQAGKALLKRVRTVFKNVYIGDTEADLAHVAKLHPPSLEPEAFVNACVDLLAPMLGEEAAQALLTSS